MNTQGSGGKNKMSDKFLHKKERRVYARVDVRTRGREADNLAPH